MKLKFDYDATEFSMCTDMHDLQDSLAELEEALAERPIDFEYVKNIVHELCCYADGIKQEAEVQLREFKEITQLQKTINERNPDEN